MEHTKNMTKRTVKKVMGAVAAIVLMMEFFEKLIQLVKVVLDLL
jgi:hypothetical protein